MTSLRIPSRRKRIAFLKHLARPSFVRRVGLYAILIMSTTLASIVGVSEVVTLAGQVQAAEGGRPELLASIYGYVLLMFFLYSYPISVWTRRLERRFAER